MKRFIITGGSGLIGRALADELVRSGSQVVILSRRPERARNLRDGQMAVYWDARSEKGWGELVNGDTAIVNLAGESIGIPPLPWTAGRKRRIRESRINAGKAVMAAIQAASEKPRVLIQASAIGYYGPHGDEFITEQEPPGNDFLARVAIDWEASTAEVETLGVRRVIMRTGLPMSSTGGMLPYLSLPFRFFVGGPVGNGRQWMSWIHIADEVGAIRYLIENESARGPYNLCAEEPLTNHDFSQVLGRVLHRPSLIPVPALALKLALGELADSLLLSGQRVLPQRLVQAGLKFRFRDAEEALRNLVAK